MKISYIFILFVLTAATCNEKMPKKSVKMNGLTFVAPPEKFTQDPFPAIKAVGANWIACVPYAFTPPAKPEVRYDVKGHQWWGEMPEGVDSTLQLAKEHGLQVMLKPQVWIPGGWPGMMRYETEADWQKWESDYENYILKIAQIAENQQVALFCIGTEFSISVRERAAFWQNLIKKIRAVYKGKLTYCANWNDWEEPVFWSELDYIGISAYFPLVNKDVPSVAELEKAWSPIVEKLREFSKKQQKPVLFTEYGYLTVPGCAFETWNLEKKIDNLPVNEQAQANALEALHRVFQKEDFWAGGFLWKWFPNMRGHEGYPEKDYTPQGKLGEKVLFKMMNDER